MKTVHWEDLACFVEWICPYAKCNTLNTEYDTEPDWLQEVTCKKCKRTMKVRSINV